MKVSLIKETDNINNKIYYLVLVDGRKTYFGNSEKEEAEMYYKNVVNGLTSTYETIHETEIK